MYMFNLNKGHCSKVISTSLCCIFTVECDFLAEPSHPSLVDVLIRTMGHDYKMMLFAIYYGDNPLFHLLHKGYVKLHTYINRLSILFGI